MFVGQPINGFGSRFCMDKLMEHIFLDNLVAAIAAVNFEPCVTCQEILNTHDNILIQ